MRDRTILITGATGALGPAVVRAFSASGWNVRTFSRRAPEPGTAAAEHPHVRGDIGDESALRSATRGVDAVVHMAALLHVVNPSPQVQAEYQRINVTGTAALLRAVARASVPRVVLLSTIAVYGPRQQLVDETTAPQPDTPYASSKIEAERIVLEGLEGPGASRGVVLRLAAVYGPHVKGNYERMVRALARRRFVPIGAGANGRTLIFEEDAARAIALAADHPDAAGRVFNVTDGSVHTVTEITGAICRALGRRPPRVAVPLLAARGLAAASEVASALVGMQPPLTRATLQKYTEHVAASGARIRKTLGFEPCWSLQDGWQQTVVALRQSGRL